MNQDERIKEEAIELHNKRIQFEPIIFNWLQQTTLPTLQEYWKEHSPPFTASKTICIIERREHPNFEYILKNVCYYCRDWSLTIICSNENYNFVKGLLEGKSATVLPLFEGIGTPEQGKFEYNELLQSERFWAGIDAEFILTVEMDCYLLRPLPQEMFTYDYVASPWHWKKDSQGGGLSLRRREAMLQICKSDQPKYPNGQDCWACDGCKLLQLKMPPFDTAVRWFMESCYYQVPVGVHQWWTFWNPKSPQAVEQFSFFTSLKQL
jgi:hypothetical protein